MAILEPTMRHSTATTVWPAMTISPAIKELVENFFVLMDSPDAGVGDILADEIFTPDGKAYFGPDVFTGTDQIRRSREFAWKAIEARHHTVLKVYVSGQAADDLLFIGTVSMGLRNGNGLAMDFAGRFKIAGAQSETPKVQHYQAWVDSAPLLKAMNEPRK